MNAIILPRRARASAEVEGFHTLVVIDGSNPMMAENIELTAAYYTLAGDVYPFGPTHVSPFPFRDRVEAAARAGWKGIGLILDDVDATAAKIGHAETTRILHANDMKYVELEFSSIGISMANAVSTPTSTAAKFFGSRSYLEPATSR